MLHPEAVSQIDLKWSNAQISYSIYSLTHINPSCTAIPQNLSDALRILVLDFEALDPRIRQPWSVEQGVSVPMSAQAG